MACFITNHLKQIYHLLKLSYLVKIKICFVLKSEY